MSFKRSLVTLCAAMAASLSAQAAFQFELKEVGPDVVLTGSGSFNLAGLTPMKGFVSPGGYMGPNIPWLQVGSGPLDLYSLASTAGAGDFGSLFLIGASVSSGDAVGFAKDHFDEVPGEWQFTVPAGYITGTQLSGSATFMWSSFASLGITPGTYTWSWGSSIATGDSVTLNAVSAVPEPSTYAMALAGLGVLGLWARRQQRRGASRAHAPAA